MTPRRTKEQIAQARLQAQADLMESHAYELHVAAQRITNAREDRDDQIRKAFADAMPVRVIAKHAELTPARVYQIVAKASS